MSGASSESLFQQGRQAATRGDLEKAHQLLVEATDADPSHEEAWLWRAITAPNDSETGFCLRRTLEINPNNADARGWLERIADSSVFSAADIPLSAAFDEPAAIVLPPLVAPAPVPAAAGPAFSAPGPSAPDPLYQPLAPPAPTPPGTYHPPIQLAPAAPSSVYDAPPAPAAAPAAAEDARPSSKSNGAAPKGKKSRPARGRLPVKTLSATALLALFGAASLAASQLQPALYASLELSPSIDWPLTLFYSGYALLAAAGIGGLACLLLARRDRDPRRASELIATPSRAASSRATVRGAKAALRPKLLSVNLLPPELQRSAFTSTAALLLLVILAGAGLSPTLYDWQLAAGIAKEASVGQLANVKTQLDKENARVAADKAEAARLDEETNRFKEEIAKMVGRATAQQKVTRRFILSPSVEAALVSQPAGLQLTSLSWQEPRLVLQGRAANLQLIMAYSGALQATGRFRTLNLHLLDQVDQPAVSRPPAPAPSVPGATPAPVPPPPAPTAPQLAFELELEAAPGLAK